MEKGGADLSSSRPSETVDQAVGRIAAAFDYSVKRRGAVFILNKMFTHPEDLPDLTIGEATVALDEITRMLAPFTPKYPEAPARGSSPAEAIASVLSPLQIQALSRSGVDVTSLAPQQRAEVWNLAMWFYLNDACGTSTSACSHFHALAALEPVFRWEKVGDQDEFGVDELTAAQPTAEFWPLSHPDTFGGYAKAPNGARYPIRISFGPPDAAQPLDPSDPSMASADEAEREAVLSRVSTIADVMRLLTRREGEGIRFTVDRELAGKSVSIAGIGNASSDQIASGTADVYGLELRHKHDGTINISRIQAISVNDVNDLPRALLAAVPRSISRCILARTGEIQAREKSGHPRISHWQNAFVDAAEGMNIIAVRDIRAVAQPLVLKAKDQKIALSKLPPSFTKVFAVSKSVRAFATILHDAERKTPPYVADFDHVILTGSSDGNSYVSVQLSIIDPNTGEVQRGPSTSYGSPPTAAVPSNGR
jgi:hypothetical protein